MIKPELTKDGIKLRNTKTGKLVGSVATAGENVPTPQDAKDEKKAGKLAQKIENMSPVKRAKYEAKLAVREAKNEAKKITASLRQRHYPTHAVPASRPGYEEARQIIATAKEEGKAKVMQARREENASALMGLPPKNTFSDDARKKRELNDDSPAPKTAEFILRDNLENAKQALATADDACWANPDDKSLGNVYDAAKDALYLAMLAVLPYDVTQVKKGDRIDQTFLFSGGAKGADLNVEYRIPNALVNDRVWTVIHDGYFTGAPEHPEYLYTLITVGPHDPSKISVADQIDPPTK